MESNNIFGIFGRSMCYHYNGLWIFYCQWDTVAILHIVMRTPSGIFENFQTIDPEIGGMGCQAAM